MAQMADDLGDDTWLLIDTCVWLDLARDHRELPVITALEELIQGGVIKLVVPEIVASEFARNRDRIAEEARAGFKTHIRLAREAVNRYGADESKAATLAALHDVDHEIHSRGDAVSGTMGRIELLLNTAERHEATDEIKSRVVERALARAAPYHRPKNSVGDAIILETYVAHMAAHPGTYQQFAFITHNTQDFSEPNGDKRLPHPDLAAVFDGNRSTYGTSLGEYIRSIAPDLLDEADFEFNYHQDPRRLSEILEAEHLLYRQVWYNRHMNRRHGVERGKIKIIPDAEYSFKRHSKHIKEQIWKGALAAAKRTEDEVGKENLGPWTDFEWGMLNGKLSALRWITGDEWDMLDT
jgi:predicted nucleic acid-binding protein